MRFSARTQYSKTSANCFQTIVACFFRISARCAVFLDRLISGLQTFKGRKASENNLKVFDPWRSINRTEGSTIDHEPSPFQFGKLLAFHIWRTKRMRFYYATGIKDVPQYLGNFKTFCEAETELYRLTKGSCVTASFLYVPECHFSIFAENRAEGSRFRLVRVLHFNGARNVTAEKETAKSVHVDIHILRRAS